MRRRSAEMLALAAAAALAAQGSGTTAAEDWPQFRGLRRDGVSSETGLRLSWSAAGPKEAWRRPIGDGFSGAAISNGRLYTMYAAELDGAPTEFAAALDPASGGEIWRTPVGKRLDTEFGNGPRSTPTIDGDTVYVLGSVGTLMALSAADGSPRWRLELTEAFGSKIPVFGFSGSVIVDSGKVILEGGGQQGKSFAAVDAKTGQVVWTLGDGGAEPGYGSPLPVDLVKKRQYVHFIGGKLRSVDAAGREVWSYPWPEVETHAIPVFVPPDRILGSGVEGAGAVLLEIHDGPSGATVGEVWKNPTFRTHFNAAVLHGDHLYGFDNATLKCVSVKDGALAWSKRGLGKGSLILAEGHLLVLSDDGRLVVAEATPRAWVEKGSVQALQGRCWTPPALSGGRLFLRNHTGMVAYDLTR